MSLDPVQQGDQHAADLLQRRRVRGREPIQPLDDPAGLGGQARAPSTQTGYRFSRSARRQPSNRTSCRQPSPKSYSYPKRNRLPLFGRMALSFVVVESLYPMSSKFSCISSGSP
jgi:hypothetical protein